MPKHKSHQRIMQQSRKITNLKNKSVIVYDMKNRHDSNTRAFIASFFSIIGFIIALLCWNKDEYVMFYAKQSLVLFIAAVIVSATNHIFNLIPFFGPIISFMASVIVVIAWFQTWIFALSGKKKNVMIIGDFARRMKI
jgi:uncharacterized membrane protein